MRYLMTFSYDGSKYNGYQKQPNMITIQSVLEDKLTQINSNNHVSISASGRTDAGVHALNQKAHFDLISDLNVDNLKKSLNKMLPQDIFVKKIEKVSDNFHARFDVEQKRYTYKINVGEYDPLGVNYIFQFNKDLNVELMKEGAKFFIGEHDFTSYTKGCEDKESYIRIIYDIDIKRYDNMVEITFLGNGFLRYMVRNMVGSLIDVGTGKTSPNTIEKILKEKDRTKAGITAPSNGLYLVDVTYRKTI